MGLTINHGVYRGPTSLFNSWRDTVAEAAGYGLILTADAARPRPDLPKEMDTHPHRLGDWETPPRDILIVLMLHYDSEGHLTAHHAAPLADRLEGLLPAIAGRSADLRPWARYLGPEEVYHVPAGLSPRLAVNDQELTATFIAGLRRGAEAGETIEFR